MNKKEVFLFLSFTLCGYLTASELANQDYPPTFKLLLEHAKCRGQKKEEGKYFKKLTDEELAAAYKFVQKSDLPADAVASFTQEIQKSTRAGALAIVMGKSIVHLIKMGHRFQIENGCLNCAKLDLHSVKGIEMFEGVGRVREINLNNNRLTEIPMFDLGRLGALKVVKLKGNPIACKPGKSIEKLMITPSGKVNIIYKDEITDEQLAQQTAMMAALMLEKDE